MLKQPRAKQAEPPESEQAAAEPLMDGSATLEDGGEPEEGEEERQEVDAAVEVSTKDVD